MPFDFPSSPIENQTFTPPGGPTYTYKAPRWIATSLAAGSVPEAPNDSNAYVRSAMAWVVGYTKSAIDALLNGKVSEAPNDSNVYVRGTLAWVIGYSKAAIDTLLGNKVNKAGDTMTGGLNIQPAAAIAAFNLVGAAGGAFHADFTLKHLGTGQNRIMSQDAAGNNLWIHYLGLNDGDWLLQRVSGGTFNTLTINRTTGVATFEAAAVAPASGDAMITLRKSASGLNSYIAGLTGANARWWIRPGNATAEGGGNSGSDFSLDRFNDSGAYLGTPFIIDRATGVVSMGSGATVKGKSLDPTADRYNMIVNPSMMISQENGTTAGNTNNYYQADQWTTAVAGTAVVGSWLTYISNPAAQEPSSGNRWHARLYVSTADTSITGSDYVMLSQNLEGTNIAKLKWGLSDARPAVLRFSALVGLAGTFSVNVRDYTGSVSYVIPFTVSAGEVNTWKDYVFAIPPCTIGTWADGNAPAARVGFVLSAGPTFVAPSNNTWIAGNYLGVAGNTNWLATVNNNFYLTDVGLYLDIDGTGRAPEYEIPDFQTELVRCQRYWQETTIMFDGDATTGINYFAMAYFPTTFRASPALSGAVSTQLGFPATVGTLLAYGLYGVREQRTCNATAAGRYFFTNITGNARP